MIKKFKVASAPHMRRQTTTKSTMIDVVVSLIPVGIMAAKYFGSRAINLMLICVFVAGVSQYIAELIFKKESELNDYSWAVTGLLLALTLPHTTPYWVAGIGSVFAIVIGKVIFGGLGKNLFNPALLGRVFLMVSYPQYLLNYRSYDGSAGATILPLLKYRGADSLYRSFGGQGEFFKSLFTGHGIYGSIGEVSIVAILVGMIYLKLRGHVKLKVPFILITTVFILAYLLGYNPFIYTLSGGLIFGAVYMATDMVTSPYTKVGSSVYAFLIGLFIVVIRKTTSHPEGVAYAILFANLLVPFINKYTKPRVFGKGYRMREIKIALMSIVLTVLGIFALFKIDEYMELEKVLKNEQFKQKQMLSLIEGAAIVGTDEETIIFGGYLFRPVFDGDYKKVGYVVEVESKGYGKDPISFLMAIDVEGVCIGHLVLDHNETKGLGSKIADGEWEEIFVGVTEDSKFDPEVDAFSGATYTFQNMHREVVSVIRAYRNREDVKEVDGEAGASDAAWAEEEVEVEEAGATDIGWEEEEKVEEPVEELEEAGATDGDWSYIKGDILWV